MPSALTINDNNLEKLDDNISGRKAAESIADAICDTLAKLGNT